jgi:ribonuclease Z
VTLLGTGGGPGGGGANMVTERMNANTLVEAGGQAFLFDAGRGAMLRLAQLGSTTIPRIDKIFLTHLHSDHIVDLSDLFLNGAGRNQRPVLNVYGPAGTAAMTGHLAKAYDWDLNYRANPKNPKLKMVGKDVDEGVVYDNGSVRVTAFRVDHWPPRKTESDREAFPALGYRLEYNGRSVVISGDTRYSRNTIKYAKGADLLIHEVHAGLDEKIVDGALTNGNGRPQAGSHHTGPKAAGTIFTRAAPKMALYTHIVWGRKSEQELIALTRETYAGPLTVGKEMMQVRVADTVEIVGSNSTGQRRTGTNP